jgi:two-component system, chemotaxis family, CheB/CheR fusion protein
MSFPIVGVGASAGGLEAFTELFREIPTDCGMAFVVIQHLDPTRPSYLGEALSRVTRIPVEEIREGTLVQPDHVYVIPSNADVGILRGGLTLLPRATEPRKPHLPIDFFLKALAADQGNQAMGVVLSGTGSDGAEGIRAIRAEDGITFAQTPGSAKFSGMPEAAINSGAVDFVLPVRELAQELVRIGRHPFVRGPEERVLQGHAEDVELKKILLLVRSASGIDFSEYKIPSIRRRLARQMALHRLTDPEAYVRLLRGDPAQCQLLFEDILIHVTTFFRDGEAFEKLKEQVFPALLKQKRNGGPIRVWSAGCSTGEEAYSLIIALLEFLELHDALDVPVQLFGTDVSERAIERARAGFFPESTTRDLSSERLARFFTKDDRGGYQIAKSVRERCAFVKHDLAFDPPFSKLDLVTCRNVLIYFGAELQKRVLATFHFALNQPGFLLLGRAENVTEGGLFNVVDKEQRIFARSSAKSVLRLGLRREPADPPPTKTTPWSWSSSDLVRRTETLLLERYAPPGVIVNERMEILHFRGRTAAYLEPAPGQPQYDLLKMAKKGLMAELRIALSEAGKQMVPVRRRGVAFEQNGTPRLCDLVVVPVTAPPDAPERIFAVLFEEPTPIAVSDVSEAPAHTVAPTDEQRLTKLQEQLRATNEYLQSLVGEHERTNRELITANEELISSNEELQSLNEELETAKEELQSTNEELATLNEELQTRNSELNSVNSDLLNILGSVEVPIVIVDGARRIRRFTPKARPILNLLPTDVGRPIDDIKPNLALESLDLKIAEVIETVTPVEEDVRGRDGRWYRLQIRPYMTTDKRIDGAVLSVVDIDVLKRALGVAEWTRDYAKATVEAVQTPLILLDEKLSVVSANEAFRERYAFTPDELERRGLYEIMNGTWDLPALRAALAGAIERNERFQRLEVSRDLPRLGPLSLSLSARAVSTPGGARLVLLAVEDVTESKRGEAQRSQLLEASEAAKANAEVANRAKDQFLATLSHELRTPLTSLLVNAQLLRRVPVSGDKLRVTAEAIERAAQAQAKLIDDLLDISRIVTGKLSVHLRPIALGAIVQAAVQTVVPNAESRQIALEIKIEDPLPPALGDPGRLQQAVLNLLNNAIKFTPPGGHVGVTVAAAGGWAQVRVRDTGVGIAPDFLPHVFDRLSQEQSGRISAPAGLGLGLAIVRYLAEAHGGTVQAESAGKGQGATFTLRLPLAKDARVAPREIALTSNAGNIHDARILLVEDDQDAREALTEMLQAHGAVVGSAESASQAMQVLRDLHPEVLVCDIGLPEEDGYSLLRQIRALDPAEGGEVPAIALTAYATEEHRAHALEVGFQVHLVKPIDFDLLVATLAELRK